MAGNGRQKDKKDISPGTENGVKALGGWMRAFALATTISFELAGAVLVGVFLGRWLDDRFNTSPWLMSGGLLLGLAAGVAGVVKTVSHFFRAK